MRRRLALLFAVAPLAFGLALAPVPARAFDTELERAIFKVAVGSASPEQLALVRQNNDIVNYMANTGHLPDHAYQRVQADFDAFNREVATAVAEKNGLDLRQQTSLKKSFSTGTDSDYLTSSRSGRTSVGQIKSTIADYNAELNRRFGTQGVDYAKKLNTDFMANQTQMSAEEFAEVAKINNDAYKRQGSAAYEAKVRDPKGTVTVDEAIDYQRDMNDLIAKKSKEIKSLRQELEAARRLDPKGTKTRVLEAKLQIRQQQQAKYLQRYTQSTAETAKRFGITPPESSSRIVDPAADRSMAPKQGLTQTELADLKRRTSSASSALEKHLTQQVKTGGAKVAVEAADKLGRTLGNVPEREALIRSAAQQVSELPPSAQGDMIEDVRRRFGDKAAKDLTAKVREFNSQRRAPPPKPGAEGEGAGTKARVLQAIAIASIANEARAWIKGEKSNVEAAEAAANLVSMGYYNLGKEAGGWKQTYDANFQAFATNQQARIYQIAVGLRREGVSKEEIGRIVEEMENGSEAALDAKIRDLKGQGIDFTKPPPVERTWFSDKTWGEYVKDRAEFGYEMAKGLVLSPFKLAWDTGKDLGELHVLTTDLFKTHRNEELANLELIELINGISQRKLTKRLIEMGASPQEAKDAVDAWLDGKPEGLLKLRKLRDKLKLEALPPDRRPKEPDAATIAARRSHIMDRITKLDDTKLTETLKALGIAPPVDVLNCACRRAGYGTSSTAQYYHPDTIGEFNPKYTCNQPGEPCVVSGFGCTRHPLPQNAAIWDTCMGTHKLDQTKTADGKIDPASGERLDERIERLLRERRR
jgi:hypothetical protein